MIKYYYNIIFGSLEIVFTFAITMGRKIKIPTDDLKIGHKLELTGIAKKFKWQYLTNFNNRGAAKFALVDEDKKVFVKRVS